MKYICKVLALGFLLLLQDLHADYGDDDALYDRDEEVPEATPGQFTLTTNGDYIARANHQSHDDDFKGNIRYNHEKVQFDAVVYYDECNKEAISLSLGYEFSYLNWNKNPFFNRRDYDTFTLAGTYFTKRLSCWTWVLQAAMNMDADKWSLTEYTTYDMLLWGRYTWNSQIGLHFGIYGETGLKLDRVWPIFGFDWTISDDWMLKAIFPLNISLQYSLFENTLLNFRIRFFNERHRSGETGGFPKAVWRYQNSGAEFGIDNNWCSWLKTNLHAGYTFGGKLKIADRHAHHTRRFRFEPSAYFGAEIIANF